MKNIDTTITPKQYKWKRLSKLLSCTVCPPHRHENASKNNQFYKKHKCWKFRTKIKKVTIPYKQVH